MSHRRAVTRLAILTLVTESALPVVDAAGQVPPPGRAVAGSGFVPGGQELFTLDLAGTPIGGFPSALRQVSGTMEVVTKDGLPMLRASEPSEFLVTLASQLPQSFTIEVDLVPKECCPPPDLTLEGTIAIDQGPASAHLLWQADNYVAVIGGAEENREFPMPEEVRVTLPGALTQVGVSVEGSTIKLYTNGREVYAVEAQFARGRFLRVSLGGGETDGNQAVYLARLRIATGAPVGPSVVVVVPSDTGTITPLPPPQPPAPPPPREATLRAGLTLSVTMGQAGPVLSWTPGPPGSTYVAQRWKREDPSCCANQSPPNQPLTGTSWQDVPLPSSGTYIYQVTATGRLGTLTAQTFWVEGGPTPRQTVEPDVKPRATEPPTPVPSPPPPPPPPPPAPIEVGTGISDITGPIAEVGMMGYGNGPNHGLHMRLYARAFIFANPSGKRVVFVNAELWALPSSVKQGVLEKLNAPESPYRGLYDDSNLMLSATHTHAGPGGFSHHVMYNLTTLGHVKQNYDAIVDGITEAIAAAHQSLAAGTVSWIEVEVPASTPTMVNRSLEAFARNPDVSGQESVNREMTVLRVERGGNPVGAIAWHAVHNTSLTNKNYLVSSDHKGYAAYLFERRFGSIAPFQNYGRFVAAFPNGAEGDLSPNLVTDNVNADGQVEFKGPGSNEFESSYMIGTREFDVAYAGFTAPRLNPVPGDVDYRHMFVKMPGLPVTSTENTNGQGLKLLCPAAYGASFNAGAEDGPSGPLAEGLALETTMSYADLVAAKQLVLNTAGVLAMGPWMDLIPGVKPALLVALGPLVTYVMASNDPCQLPKPVLIPSGALGWTPEILPFQLLRIGPVAIAGIPGEMTVQAGRRLRASLKAALAPIGVQLVILTGLANEYSGYITTPEEYDSQQYEGASTLWGRLTFEAYQQIFRQLADAMAAGQAVPPPPPPPPLKGQIELQTGVVEDVVPVGGSFGEVLKQPPGEVVRGGQVNIAYRSGHPKNGLQRNNSYISIERQEGTGWNRVAWDGMPETKLYWSRPEEGCGSCSQIDVLWRVPSDAIPGTYRIRFVTYAKNLSGTITRYVGGTNNFVVR
jgi:neutral ceramidase